MTSALLLGHSSLLSSSLRSFLHYLPAHTMRIAGETFFSSSRKSRRAERTEECEGRSSTNRPTERTAALAWCVPAERSADAAPALRFTPGFGGREGGRENFAERLLSSTNVAFIIAFAYSHSTVLNVLTSVQS